MSLIFIRKGAGLSGVPYAPGRIAGPGGKVVCKVMNDETEAGADAPSPHSLYAGFFGLRERPFTLLPDPGFLYWSSQHRRAFSVLEFGLLSRAPVTLITGEIGSGMTTLLR